MTDQPHRHWGRRRRSLPLGLAWMVGAAASGLGQDGATDPGADVGSAEIVASVQQDPTTLEQLPDELGADGIIEEEDTELGDSVITASRGRRRTVEIPQATTEVDVGEIRDRVPQTTPDALSEEVGVVVQKTNQGGGSPIIRGRTGKSVLLLLDGLRFNNATFRRNTQYLNTIDLAAVDRLEVIRGPASVLYGSDAMGGAVNILTRRSDLDQGAGFGGRLFGSFSTANQGLVSHVSVEGRTEDLGVTLGATYKAFDDLRAGSHGDPVGAVDRGGVQDPTGYTETDLSFSSIYRLDQQSSLDFLLLHSRQDDVPRSDRLIANDQRTPAPDLQRDFDPQILRWYQARYRWENERETDLVQRFRLSAVFQNPEETRRRIRSSNPDEQIIEQDEVRTPGLSAQWELQPLDDHRLTAGAEAYFEEVRSDRVTVDLNTRVRTPTDGRFPDGATYQSYGVYLEDEWRIDDDWRWTGGLRYSLFRVRADFDGLTVGPRGPIGRESEMFDDVTFATGLSRRVSDTTWIYGTIARGFRAPNLDDLAVLGDFASGDRVPNFDLQPEKVWSFEVGAKRRGDRLRSGVAGAVAYYEDLLDTEVAFNDGTQDFFQVANRGRAVIYTAELSSDYVVVESDGASAEHVVFGNAFGNWGRNLSEKEPVSKVPPPQAELGYRLQEPDGAWFGELFLRGALEQNRLSQSDRDDPRIPGDGTPSWWTVNLRGGVRITDGVDARVSLENLFDQRYRVHGSGIDAAGINLTVALDCRF